MATAAIDTAYIAAAYSVPEPTLQTLLDAPTTELVQQLLAKIESRAHEFDEVKAEKLRSDVELENAVRTGDSRARALKASVDKNLKELEEVRKKLNEEENARASLESELQNLKSSSTTSSSETEVLRTRVSTLEASNRETIALLEAKTTAHDNLAEELSAQHQKIVALRREISELEDKNQAAQNAATTTKFRQQSLQQEIDLLKKNNEWYESELQTKNAEYSKYRKEKSAKISELQRMYDDANDTIESMRRTEATLRSRIDEINQKAEDSLSKIQQLQEAAAKADEQFRVELDSSRRLADLQKQSADTARGRLQEVQASFDKVKEDAAEELGQMQAEVETERSEKEMALRKIEELEIQVEKLESDISSRQQNTVAITGTPRRPVNGLGGAATPGRSGSPTFGTPGYGSPSRVKGGLTFTQLYAEHAQIKSELDAERRRNAKLSSTIDEMIQDLEAKQPEIEELRAGHQKLENNVLEISELLEEANRDRDAAKKESRKWSGQVEGLQREGDVLRQQLQDLSNQVKALLFEVTVRDQGLEALSAAEQAEFEKIVRGEIDVEDGVTDTSRFITQRLVIFRNIEEIQEQNAKLLQITRQLGEQMEGEEARAKKSQAERDQEELEELRMKASRYEDELKSLNTVAESYQRERDMFRRMLTHRGQIPPGSDLASMFGESVGSSTPPPGGFSQSIGPGTSPHAKDLADYAKLLKELQSHFDAFRKESTTDHAMLKEQADRLAKEKSDLQMEINRTGSQLTLAHERYELLQANFNQLRSENAELQKRGQALAETSAKQDLKAAQIAEELYEAKASADGLRHEAANLKAEKELWKNIETRLTEDNRALNDERTRLNKMIADLQNLQNERELADSETRRRLQTRIETLESELQTTKRKLDNEVEDGKRTALRREYESEQNRTRIDDLVKSLGNTREELVAAKTQRDQLQARVDELRIELRNAEEKAVALAPRPTARRESTIQNGEAESSDLNREQELAIEVADLKRDLEIARNELETSKAHVEQYKAIAQASEEELQSINETHDQYREEMDGIIAEKDAKIRDLEQRVEEISTELATTNTELSKLRTGHEENLARFNEQRAILQSEIDRLKDESERYQETAKLCQEDLKAQATIAQQAQQSYESELVKHAEAAQNLQKVRTEHNQLKAEVAEIRAEAQAAKTALESGEDSWNETRARYEREISDLKIRRDEVNDQNKRLHEQLETVSSQIAALKQSRASLGAETAEAGSTPPPETENLQEVIRYLRREKDIVEVQWNLAVQESDRVKKQLEHTQSQLDETREKLNKERQNQIENQQTSVSHAKLMETINELNLHRESSVTLRNEKNQAQAQLAERIKEIESLQEQIEPLRNSLRELENDVETKSGELKQLKEDRDRWQQRTQNILQKYDRVDPEELAELKNKITTLEAERDQLQSEKAPLQAQIDGFEDTLANAKTEITDQRDAYHNERREKLIEQFKTRSRELSGKIKDANLEKEAAKQAKEQLELELAAVKDELEKTKAAHEEALANAKPPQADTEMQDTPEEGEAQEGQESGVPSPEAALLEARAQAAEKKASEEADKAAKLQKEVEALNNKVQELETQISELQGRLDTTTSELTQLNEAAPTQTAPAESTPAEPTPAEIGPSEVTEAVQPPAANTEILETLEKVKAELADAQKEVENLRASATSNSAGPTAEGAEGSVPADQVAEQIAKIKAEAEESVQAAQNKFQQRADQMRSTLNKKLSEGKQALRQENEEAIQKLKEEHEQAMQQLKTEHESEIDRIKAEHREELERLKNAAPAEQAASAPTDSAADATTEPAPPSAAPEIKSEASKFSDLTDQEVKDLVNNNNTVKAIITRNVKTKLSTELEAKTKELSEKHQKEAEELQKKADNAVAMAEKRVSLKLNMAQNRERNATAKIEVVQKAAEETPERAVGEVWAVAKDAKPTPAAPAAAPAPVPAPPQPAQQQPQAQAPNTQAVPQQVQQPSPQAGGFGQPAQPAQPQQQLHRQVPVNQFQGQQGQPPMNPFPQNNTGIPRPGSAMGQNNQFRPNSPFQQQQIQGGQVQFQPQQTGIPNMQNNSLHSRPGPPQQGQPNMGTGPGALRGLMGQGGTGIPRGGGIPRPGRGGGQAGAQQGQQGGPAQSSLPRRGGGQGRGRGGGQAGQHQVGQEGGAGAGRGMNVAAKQFVPNKRPREDGADTGGQDGGPKRARGGGNAGS
ncbi:Prefoldin [Botryosphaeria dothidea]|uniref:Prefoldin n=1 Tax=Botryosphaeria dothidea TaxID=55169 RepID=A0A8H4J6T1_9PEZI|nr:Prefoldin [Botryosphaeria dothidea]